MQYISCQSNGDVNSSPGGNEIASQAMLEIPLLSFALKDIIHHKM